MDNYVMKGVLKMINEIIELFTDESFRHWFFWTAVILVIVGGPPSFVRVYKK